MEYYKQLLTKINPASEPDMEEIKNIISRMNLEQANFLSALIIHHHRLETGSVDGFEPDACIRKGKKGTLPYGIKIIGKDGYILDLSSMPKILLLLIEQLGN